MSITKHKSTNTRNKSLKRNPMAFSMRQKKKKSSEVRRNTTTKSFCKDSSPPLSAFEDYPSPMQIETEEENLSPVTEETTANRSHSTSHQAVIIPSTPKQKDIKSVSKSGQIFDPAVIFPYSNKPHETKQKTIAEESKQWESLFDPQHTFGSFQTSIAKPISSQQYFYKGKWPLDQEDIMGMIPKTKKLSQQQKSVTNTNGAKTTTPNLSITEESNPITVFAFPTVPSPTLPDRKQLQLHINPVLQDNNNENEDDIFDNSFPKSSSEIEILPCPSLTQFPKYKKPKNETLWKDRLELLNTIQQQGFREELNGTLNNGQKESATARLQRQLRQKSEKIKRETLADSSPEEEKEEEHSCNVLDSTEDGTLLVAVELDTLHTESTATGIEKGKKENQDTDNSLHTNQYGSSLVSLSDEWENISFKPPYSTKDVDIEKQSTKEEVCPVTEIKRRNRPTFLLFAYGFLFPPLWVIGALYNPNSFQRTTFSEKIDRKWKNYSRNASFVFAIIVAIIIVLILVLQPEAVGFRSSSEQVYPKEIIIFDEKLPNVATATASAAAGQ
jgi:hypothetical protein